MSQSNVGDFKDTQSEKPPTPNYDDEFPWFTLIMMGLCLIGAVVAFVKFIISLITVGY